MSGIDWAVMLGTLLFIVGYGVWKTRKSSNLDDYLLGNRQVSWWTIGLSVMATQASAITFLSVPGQAFTAGMGFAQFYFGLPLAMIVISLVFIPLYYRLKVYTAYEFLEGRFDLTTRLLTAGLFLIQRGLAAGITIYAPAIILATLLELPLTLTVIFIGTLVIVYTVTGGTKAVSQTHKQQMAVIFIGMFLAFGFLIYKLSPYFSFAEGLQVAGKMGKMNLINTDFDPSKRYTIWSGLIAGFFLQLSYFGTDQSQVQRYLTGRSIRESRLGLLFNGLLKIPMQVFILLCGILVFLFYQHNPAPLHFNQENVRKVVDSERASELVFVEGAYQLVFAEKSANIQELTAAIRAGDETAIEASREAVMAGLEEERQLRDEVRAIIKKVDPKAEVKNDDDYIFISWVMDFMPIGLVGLLLAVIFSAAMSSTSAELNALASTATVDVYKRVFRPQASGQHYVAASRLLTLGFGVFAVGFALVASLFDNLIEAVNILGSLFYGTILGVFLVAFFIRYVKGRAVLIAAIISQSVIITLFVLDYRNIFSIGYLWYNLIGPLLVVVLSLMFQVYQELYNNKTPDQ